MFEVLYVEDEFSSIRLVEEAFAESGLGVDFRAVQTGSEAIAALTCGRECRVEAPDAPDADAADVADADDADDADDAADADDADDARPDLVLLDLDLTEMSGFDVLKRVRDRPALCSIPVVVFTSSEDTADIEAAYECGANAYVRKPDDFEGLVAFARRAVDFWNPGPSTADAADAADTAR